MQSKKSIDDELLPAYLGLALKSSDPDSNVQMFPARFNVFIFTYSDQL